MICKICKGNNVVKVRTLKHFWFCCNDCSSATRESVPNYENTSQYKLSFKTLVKHKPPMADSIIKNKAVTKDPSLLFDYMASEKHIDIHKKNYKVFEQFVEQIITHYSIDVKDKNILDVSGGNGNFIKEFEKFGAHVSMTEFNQKSVDFAKEKFQIDARRFDFNSESIANTFPDKKFDIVMLRFAVMFCEDMNRFLSQLNHILNPGAIIIINGSTEPTIGIMLRFQYDDYAYLALYGKEKLKSIFTQNKFNLIGEHPINKVDKFYFWDMHSKVKRLDFLLYRMPAFLKWKNRDTRIHTNVFIFKKQ